MFKIPLPNFSICAVAFAFFQLATAQHNVPLGPPPLAGGASSALSTSGAAPSAVTLSPAALSSAAVPFAAIPTSSDPGPSSDDPDSDDAPTSHPVLNYYFFFLAIFVIAIIALYWFLRRKRKRVFANAVRMQRHALAADLERWPGDQRAARPWGYDQPRTGRWYGLRPLRAQEGLNERGEAPPAYVAKPEPVHSPTDTASTPAEWMDMSGKPPEYHGGSHT